MRNAQYRRNPDDNPWTTPTPTITSEYTRIAWLLPGRIPLSIAPAASSGTEIFAAVQETPASTPHASVGRWEPSVPRISRQPARRVSRSRSTSSPSTPRAPRLAAFEVGGVQAEITSGLPRPPGRLRDCGRGGDAPSTPRPAPRGAWSPSPPRSSTREDYPTFSSI